jgi:hypothetical protein
MNSEGQVFFDAGDGKITEEEKARYQEARHEEYQRLVAELSEENERRWLDSLGPTEAQRAHEEKRDRIQAAFRAEAEARWGSGESKEE